MHRSQVSDTVLSDEELLDKAATKAARLLEISPDEFARIVPNNDAMAKREAQLLFIRLFRSLDAIVGGDGAVAASWMRNQNHSLNCAPIEKIKDLSGLHFAVRYLDEMRAKI